MTIEITVTHRIELTDGTLKALTELATAAIADMAARAPAQPRQQPVPAQLATEIKADQPVIPAPAAPAVEDKKLRPPSVAATPLCTPERDQIIRARYPGEGASAGLVAALNALPGRSYEARALTDRAKALAVRRVHSAPAAPAAEASQERVPETPRAVAGALPPVEQPTQKRLTAERIAILEAEWPKGTPLDEIEAMIAATPGGPIPRDRIAIYAAGLKLRRPAKPATASSDAPQLETVDWPAAERWARENKVKLPPTGDKVRIAAAINQARSDAGLPLWKIIEPRGKIEKLPPSSVGGGDPTSYIKPREAVR